jgi:hypothetical protein
MDASLNIVELIENNPITKLSHAYNGKMLKKIQESFTNFEQQLFVSSFYCYLNCDQNKDFIIDLDNVWKWLGFSQKSRARDLLEKSYKVNNDYTILLAFESKQDIKPHGGHNIKKYMLTVKTFKSLCLKAGTKKADEIHDYYLKMEEMIHQVVQEESNELKLQLEQKDNIIMEIKETAEQEKLTIFQKNKRAIEQVTIDQFPVNTECVYFGTIDNIEGGEKLLKFGQTNDLQSRVYNHRGKFENFILVTAFKVQNKIEIENLIKSHHKIKKQLRRLTLNDKVYKEIIAYDETKFTLDNLTYYIKEIIQSKQYSIENFNALTKRNDELEIELASALEKINELVAVNVKNVNAINELTATIESQQKQLALLASEYQEPILEKDEQTKRFDEFIDSCCIVRSDVEESSVDMEGQFRIWNKVKPSKETFHLFKQYLDTRFRPKRLQKQDKNQVVHGYAGVKLLPIEYKRICDVTCDVETFVFNVCRFSPCGKILNSTLLSEYQRWKKKMNKDVSDDDMREIKQYLNSSVYVQKGTVWVNSLSNEGYYGLSLKEDDTYVHKNVTSTGKRVNKICSKTNQVLNTWTTIIKAATAENMCASKMSRSIKNKIVHNDYFYVSV